KYTLAAAETLESISGVTHMAIYHAYDSLVRLAVCADCGAEERTAHLAKVSANQEKLKVWAHHGPANYGHKYLLVEAERARVLGQTQDATDLYERAITAARENRYLNDEALSTECYSRFWARRGNKAIASLYLQDARRLYGHWG